MRHPVQSIPAILFEALKPDPSSRIHAMSPSGAEVIRQIKSQVEELDPSEVKAEVATANGDGPVLVDVRESTEWDAGHIPGAKHVPRGYLESRIEGVIGDRSRHVVLY